MTVDTLTEARVHFPVPTAALFVAVVLMGWASLAYGAL
jgi:hypothetical protein